MNNDISLLFIGAILGALISLVFTILWSLVKIFYFWLTTTRKLIGEYDVTLKNGNKYPNENITYAKIFKAKGRMVEFEMELKNPDLGNSKGQIIFSTKNYGRGWYQHIKEPRYGFADMFIMQRDRLAFLRKYTTDTKKDKGKDDNSFKSVETSFIWTKK